MYFFFFAIFIQLKPQPHKETEQSSQKPSEKPTESTSVVNIDDDDEEPEIITTLSDDDTQDVLPSNEALPELYRRERQQRQRSAVSRKDGDKKQPASIGTVSDGKLLQVLAARAVDSESLKKKLEELCGLKDFVTAERVNWGQWLASCAGQVAPARWESFRQETYDLMCRYVPTHPTPLATTSVTSSVVCTTPTITRSLSAPSSTPVATTASTLTTLSSARSISALFSDQQQQPYPQPQQQALQQACHQYQQPAHGQYMSPHASQYYGYSAPSLYLGQSVSTGPVAGTSGASSQGQVQAYSTPNPQSEGAISNLTTPEMPSASTSTQPSSFTTSLLDSLNVLNPGNNT